ncbi:MAG TPA: flagellar assembly protein FliW [Methylomirabilota bacterium]|nr:flagellar assembly protein FliW [Methylomirabilota bacterium]
MKTAEANELETLTVNKENIISLPLGLLGFENVKRYVLLSNPEEKPFLWLQMLDGSNQGFVVISPEGLVPDYAPDISEQDVAFLGLKDPADAIILNIVTLGRDGEATVNLKGPIVINRFTLVGKQVIPTNVQHLALRHPLSPLPVAA